ncbi:hypothetical protein [uncultured Methanobrevibacter sp.]|nr:hypothetical protein [uncultured Methanobrevibacter sp.]
MSWYRDEYIANHSLDFDIEHSACGSCQYVNDCRYYYGACPNGGDACE